MIKKILLSITLIVFLISCSNYRTVTQAITTSLSPDEVRLNLSLTDFELLGKTEISTVSRRYFGIVNRIDSVNNRLYNRQIIKKVKLQGYSDIKIRGPLKNAAYKAIEDFPDADFYLIGKSFSKIQNMFLGRKIRRTMEIHAYRYKKIDNSNKYEEINLDFNRDTLSNFQRM
jgi:hypothetical protein